MVQAETLRARLERERAGTTLHALAAQYEVSPTYLASCISGRKKISDRMARAMGYRRVIRFERLS